MNKLEKIRIKYPLTGSCSLGWKYGQIKYLINGWISRHPDPLVPIAFWINSKYQIVECEYEDVWNRTHSICYVEPDKPPTLTACKKSKEILKTDLSGLEISELGQVVEAGGAVKNGAVYEKMWNKLKETYKQFICPSKAGELAIMKVIEERYLE
ncbi:MAG: hypothetical protein WC516_06955 [Patescibacteria group bacterium]